MRYFEKLLLNQVVCLYGSLLLLLPYPFRVEFGAEIRDIFFQVLQEAEQRGALWLLKVSLRELSALVGAIGRENWVEFLFRVRKLNGAKDWTGVVFQKFCFLNKSMIVWIAANFLGMGAVGAIFLLFASILS
jgi:hypothetical protein